jgi:hypothetical protein
VHVDILAKALTRQNEHCADNKQEKEYWTISGLGRRMHFAPPPGAPDKRSVRKDEAVQRRDFLTINFLGYTIGLPHIFYALERRSIHPSSCERHQL